MRSPQIPAVIEFFHCDNALMIAMLSVVTKNYTLLYTAIALSGISDLNKSEL